MNPDLSQATPEEQFRLLVESAHDYAIFVTDKEGTITSWNAGVRSILGYEEAEFVGQKTALLFTPEDRERDEPQREMETAARQGRALDERWHLRKDGSRFFASGVMTALRDGAAEPLGYGKILRDLTERKQAGEALQESEERFRQIVEAVQDYAIFLLSPEGRVLTWNPGAERLTGYTEEEILGQSVSVFFTPEDLARGQPGQELRTATETGRSEAEYWRVRRDGSRFWGNEILNAIRDEAGALHGFTKIIRDLTERRAAEEALRIARDELEQHVQERTQELLWANQLLKDEAQERKKSQEAGKELLRRLESAQEEERHRISRDLHDRAGQSLTAFQLGLAALENAAASPDEFSRTLAQLKRTADALARELHTLALDLRPIALDDVGLPGALESYVEEWAERSGRVADFQGIGWEGAPRLPGDIETTIYRVVQEALNNVAKHAKARQVSVLLERGADRVSAIIEDDGVGFDAEALLAAPLAAGVQRRLGLLGIRERAALVEGEGRIESSPGQGTTVFLRIPLPPRDGA